MAVARDTALVTVLIIVLILLWGLAAHVVSMVLHASFAILHAIAS